ncbi:ankyrin repeat-containing domain protein [Daldinia bambusicola]|nr:ankyrin repeat-containing domain protein [Daldinia bambusicola]
MCCIIRQIIDQRPNLLPRRIIEKFESRETLTGSFQGLWEILIDLKSQVDGEIICIMDAFDECEEEGRSQLTEALGRLPVLHFPNNRGMLKFVLTSRPYSTIWRGFERLKQCIPIIQVTGESRIDSISREINMFIEDNIYDLGPALKLSESEKGLFRKAISAVPHHTYLWANLVFEAIRNNVDITRDELQQYVQALPRTVEAAYDKILCRTYDPSEAKRLLGIVVAATRPLSLNEMAVALAIGESHHKHDDLPLEPEDRFSRTVRDLSGCFITIVESKIYLLHETARDFLIKTQTAQTSNILMDSRLRWKHSLDTVESHRLLANVCIWYLLLDPFETYHQREDISDSTNISIDLLFLHSKKTSAIYPFLEYSAQNWLTHYQQARFQQNDPIRNSMFHLLDSVDTRLWYNIWASLRTERPQFYSPLTRASCFGLEEVVRQLLGQGNLDIESKDTDDNQPPLMWAAQEGHDVIVELLLDRGANVNSDYFFDTPLIKAVKNKHVIVTSTLLTRGADIEAADITGKTPLFYATALKEGHDTQSFCDDLAKLLLERGANIQARDITGRTPLSYAAEEGCDATVRLLLENGADIELKDNEGRTALSYAAEEGHDAVTQILLEQGADVSSRDSRERQPLYYAVKWQHSSTIEVLLGKITRLSMEDSSKLLACSIWGDQDNIEKILHPKIQLAEVPNDALTSILASAGLIIHAITQLYTL